MFDVMNLSDQDHAFRMTANAFLAQLSRWGGWNKAQKAKLDEAHGGGLFAAIKDSEKPESAEALLDFLAVRVEMAQKNFPRLLPGIRRILVNILSQPSPDCLNFIGELAVITDIAAVPGIELTGLEVKIFPKEKASRRADIALSRLGKTELADILNIHFNAERLDNWQSVEKFIADRIDQKIEKKTHGRTGQDLFIIPVLWGDLEFLSRWSTEFLAFFKAATNCLGPFAITEFSRDGKVWEWMIKPMHHLIQKA